MKEIQHLGVKQAIHRIIYKHPFFGALLLQQNIKEDYSCKTFYVDGVSLGFNPDFADTLSFDEIGGVLIHELYHLTFLHHVRMQNRDHDLWNRACDYAINILVADAGFKLPKNVLLDYKYKGKTAEDIYRLLFQEKQEQEKQKQDQQKQDSQKGEPSNGGGESDSEDNKDEGEDSKPDDNKSEDDKDSEGEESGDGDNEEGGEDNKDAEGDKEGEDKDGEPKDNKSEGESNNEDNKEVTFGEVRQAVNPQEAEENIKVQTKKAIIMAKQAGELPGGDLIDMIEKSQAPRYNWVELLNQFLTDLSNSDYSFEVADDRFLNRGVILPTMSNPSIGNIVFAVDTSGSVSTDEVRILVNEVRHCLDIISEGKAYPTLTVIYCDYYVQGVDILDGDIQPNPKGGGGTRFGPVFEYIDKNDIQPDALFYITDGDASHFGDIIPEYPVKWCLTTSFDCYIKNCGFGDIIQLHDMVI